LLGKVGDRFGAAALDPPPPAVRADERLDQRVIAARLRRCPRSPSGVTISFRQPRRCSRIGMRNGERLDLVALVTRAWSSTAYVATPRRGASSARTRTMRTAGCPRARRPAVDPAQRKPDDLTEDRPQLVVDARCGLGLDLD
jgi:hypothetical protein